MVGQSRVFNTWNMAFLYHGEVGMAIRMPLSPETLPKFIDIL